MRFFSRFASYIAASVTATRLSTVSASSVTDATRVGADMDRHAGCSHSRSERITPAVHRAAGRLEWKRSHVTLEDAVNETLLAYLLGPAVMVVLAALLWMASRHERQSNQRRADRWLDTHYVDLMHHRH
ncbi:hypothetical protein PPMP20_03090 [Paraburkholderia phymatum]|uniref:Transmembrane protein n=1 Tax=Paraburkholderia phymatum (strain DSM 17167 / CIP 108236 / LMG 21445 / STM815) TaxID=391038 RepID=B2JWU6_PARP8|nr:hypothetical protein Bphy_6393 [Paraburkholderia phymatum STM815]